MRFGITFKIGALALVLTLLTAIAVGWVFYSGINNLLIQKKLLSFEEELRLQAIPVVSEIEALRQDVVFLSRTPPIVGIFRARQNGGIDPLDGSTEKVWRQRLAIIFTEFLKAKPRYLQLRYIGLNNDGKEIVRVNRTQNGIVEVPPKGLQAKGDQPYFRDTVKLNRGELLLSEISLNREFDKIVEPATPVLRAAVPIHLSAGKVIGMVVINIDFGAILDDSHNHKDHDPEDYEHFHFITNDKGYFLFHPDSSKTFGFEREKDFKIQKTYTGLEALFDKKNDISQTSIFSETAGETKVVSFLKIPFDPLHPKRFLGFVKSVPYKKVVADSVSVRNHSILLTIFLLVCAAISVVFLSRVLTLPLSQIIEATRKFSRGDYDVPLNVASKDEIGDLANSFNKMVSSRKMAEERLKMLSQAIEQSPNHVMITDKEGKIEFVNPSFLSFYGYDSNEVIGQTPQILKSGYHTQIFYKKMWETILAGKEWKGEYRNKKKNGEIVRELRSIIPIKNSEGEVSHFVSVQIDDTERRLAEIKIKHYAQELERSNKELEAFAYIASHDLQEPLRKIMTFSDRLNEKYSNSLDDQGKTYLDRLFKAANRMGNFISDLLEFSKLNTKSRQFNTVDLNEILQNIISDLEARIVETDASIKTKNLPTLDADKLQMHQLFQNLIGNSLKFHRKGVPPEVSIEGYSTKNGFIRIAVTDNGIGFDMKFFQKILKPFERLHGMSKFQGSGIGLAIFKKIIDHHGGTISCKSAPEEGTTFIITFPQTQLIKNEENMEPASMEI